MTQMVLGTFTNRADAENAIGELKTQGYNAKDISIIMKDKGEAKAMGESTGVAVADGAASGATTGGVIGAIAGLLVGLGAITVPGLGELLIAGPIAAS